MGTKASVSHAATPGSVIPTGTPDQDTQFDQQDIVTALGDHLNPALAGQLWHEAARQAGVEYPVTTWQDAHRIASHLEQIADALKSEVARPLRVQAIMQRALTCRPAS